MPASPLYNVVICDRTVHIERIEPGADGYDAARKHVLLRERDVNEAYLKAADKALPEDGIWSFASVVNAKSFALLELKKIEEYVEDNLDRIQEYKGEKAG